MNVTRITGIDGMAVALSTGTVDTNNMSSYFRIQVGLCRSAEDSPFSLSLGSIESLIKVWRADRCNLHETRRGGSSHQ